MDKLICVGKFTGPHGIRGQVKVHSYTDVPSDVVAYGLLYDKNRSREFDAKYCFEKGNIVVVSVAGIDDRNMAESLRGIDLYVPRDVFEDTDDDEFYLEDLVGLSVKDSDGNALGEVIALHNFGAGDLVEIKFLQDNDRQMVAFTKEQFPVVDLEQLYIVLNPND